MASTPAPTRGTDWHPPWLSLPSDLPGRLAPAIPAIMQRIIETVPEQIPAYVSARDGRYGENLTRGVTAALEQLMSLPGTARPALSPETRALMAYLGAGEFREGRTMDALFGAYRASARIVFRDLSAECAHLGMGMSVVIDLGESIWAYIDELSSVSAQAYAEAQSAQAGVLELHRAALATALVRGGTEEKEVQRLAALADWRLPRRLAVVVLPADAGVAVRERLGRAGLVVERDSEVVAVIDATPSQGRRERMLRLLAGTAAVVGPAVDWPLVPHSYRVARTLAVQEAAGRTAEPAQGEDDDGAPSPILAADHLARVVLGAEPRVVTQLAERVLAPLDEVSEAKRAVLEETLLAWLTHWGQRAPIAAELGVHPQTVGYRVGRLRELFGEALEDPDARFDLEIVLRARRDGVG
ncbi:helix-turn-helix domain-containing protein [Micrococcus luteus]|uniref:PucR family transcriptional regulator n=2 Tax=Micrococcus luteus TaxID=1270 RepID=UPI0018EF05A6|nr:helix-turn-helix domain-containing protein [Micrococcus luteus]MCV7502963.1 helix-turn-helix domain-containing protein [Micrococcus luteus]MCV7554344.1 helix-turn-helix domain-containing protein [Micrococcus luteus]MCV7557652.1 helix-turn-helix domain-containing protein [Micrococcus luteus]